MKDTNPDHYKVDGANFIKYMDDPQIKGFGDWMFANGYNVAEMDYMPKKGSWIRHGIPPEYVVECSVCGQKYFNHAMQSLANYCSMCGAKMESWMVENQTEVT